MHHRRFRIKPKYTYTQGPAKAQTKWYKLNLTFWLFTAALCLFMSGAAMFLKNISCQIQHFVRFTSFTIYAYISLIIIFYSPYDI